MKRMPIVIALVLAGCSAGTAPPPSARPAAAPPVAAQAAAGSLRGSTHELLNATLWTQTAVEHDAAFLQAYSVARDRLDEALKDPTWTAAVEQTGDASKLPPAVILDVDETCLDNSAFEGEMIATDRIFDADAWRAWVDEARAPALPGVLDFLRYAEGKGVTIFYVTNRTQAERPGTLRNLQALGFPLKSSPDTLLCPGDRPEWANDKGTRRKAVADAYRVLLLFGDDLGDFISSHEGTVAERAAKTKGYADRWGRKWIVLPNPMYGSWDRALYAPVSRAEQAKVIEKKRAAVRAMR